MSLLNLFGSKQINKDVSNHLKLFLNNFSIEVMPRTAAKIESINDNFPQRLGLTASCVILNKTTTAL